LDRNLNSYFLLHVLTKLTLVVVSLKNCTSSVMAFQALRVLNIFLTFGVSVLASNLLCHRILFAKAKCVRTLV
jgi:hypothetical protein